jgi:2-amino-4-hydroxy-6-hydroxymethyldihydropteridine diphosphokinase
MEGVYILLGGNEGDREARLQQAVQQINAQCGPVVQQSSVYETAAWGLEDQPDFLNQAICIRTLLSPQELLQKTLAIEKAMGRHRVVKWGQRTIDIDIIFYGEQIVQEEQLVIPHPMMQDRRFVLAPLHEIAPNLVHPVLHKTVRQLLDECPDKLEVRRIS